jgi:hypothetical protein
MSKEAPPASDGPEVLVNDLEFPWDDDCAYEVLNRRLSKLGLPQLGSHSSMQEVRDAFFDVQSGSTLKDRRAWDALRVPDRRIVIDFFHYAVPEFNIDLLDPASLEKPMPVAAPDFAGMAECPVALPAKKEPPQTVSVRNVLLESVIELDAAALLRSMLIPAEPELTDILDSNEADE